MRVKFPLMVLTPSLSCPCFPLLMDERISGTNNTDHFLEVADNN